MSHVQVTKRATYILGIRCIENGNSGLIYHDHDHRKEGIDRIIRFDGQTFSRSTTNKKLAADWIADFEEGIASGEFEAIH